MKYLYGILALFLLVLVVGCSVSPATQSPPPASIPPPTSPSSSTSTPSASPTPTPVPTTETLITVTRVIDGDTIEVNVDGEIYDVRYIGIDTPEMNDQRPEIYALAQEATEVNRRLVEGRIVSLEKDVSDTDKYGRLLRYVYLDRLSKEEVIEAWGTSLSETRAVVYLLSLIDEGKPLFVNAILVALGYAQVYTYPPDLKYNDYFLELQGEAQKAGWGFWATIPSPPEPTASVQDVQITCIFYDGLVPRVESDEYVEITNLGDQPQDLTGWVLKDISEGYPSFIFPSYILAPGKSIRVYTNEVHPEWGGFSFGYGKAVWNNSEPDVAALYDSQGNEVSRRSY